MQTESGGNCTVKGKSGELGCFQMMPKTYTQISKEIAGRVLPYSSENQEYIATKKIEKLSKTHNEREVALIWNTSLGGSEKPKEVIGKNKYGVTYNSITYANSVIKNLKQ